MLFGLYNYFLRTIVVYILFMQIQMNQFPNYKKKSKRKIFMSKGTVDSPNSVYSYYDNEIEKHKRSKHYKQNGMWEIHCSEHFSTSSIYVYIKLNMDELLI
jgi:hypothetical protein